MCLNIDFHKRPTCFHPYLFWILAFHCSCGKSMKILKSYAIGKLLWLTSPTVCINHEVICSTMEEWFNKVGCTCSCILFIYQIFVCECKVGTNRNIVLGMKCSHRHNYLIYSCSNYRPIAIYFFSINILD